jgi:hypothetical protein
VRNSADLEICKLIFVSKHKLALQPWDSANKDGPFGQMEFPIFS